MIDNQKDKNYYIELLSSIENKDLINNSQARKEVLETVDLSDAFIKDILEEIYQLRSFTLLVIPENKKYLIELIKLSQLDDETKEFVLNMEEELSLFVPVGAGGGGGPKSRKKEKTEEEVKKQKEVFRVIIVAAMIITQLDPFTNIVKLKELDVEKEKLEFQESKLRINNELEKEKLELEKERMEIINKKLEDEKLKENDDYNQIY